MDNAPEAGYWREDRHRYGRGSWLVQPSFWAVMVYRFGRWTKNAPAPIRACTHAIYFLAYSYVRVVTGIDIPRGASFGPGLLIHHFGGIIVNPQVQVGANCTIRQGVTIGTKYDSGDVPVLGDNVTLGAYAQILGKVRVGNGVTVGAMTLVLEDVPDRRTVVGIPARIVGADLPS